MGPPAYAEEVAEARFLACHSSYVNGTPFLVDGASGIHASAQGDGLPRAHPRFWRRTRARQLDAREDRLRVWAALRRRLLLMGRSGSGFSQKQANSAAFSERREVTN